MTVVSVSADDIYNKVKNARNFTGKVVLVTGSTSGLGETTVKLFSSLGARVVITGLNGTRLKKVGEEVTKLSPQGLKPLEILADLKKEEDVQRLIDKTIKEFGRLDILVNNAFTTSVHSIRDKNILEHFDNNFGFLRSVIRLVHLSIPYLEKSKGTIINISSVSSIKPVGNYIVYNMVKAAMNMMSKVLAVELGPSGIRVNSVLLGAIETHLFASSNSDPFSKFAPLRRMGTTGDVVKGILFLASTDAEFITGIDLVIDGGIRYNWPANFRNPEVSQPKQTEEPKNVTEYRKLNSKFSKVELNPWRELNAISTNSSFTKHK